jgi:hypothetical protein
MKFTGFESNENIAEMAKNEINKMGDPNFEEKFERVKPALQERGFYPKDEKENFVVDNSAKELENQQKIEEVRNGLANLNKPTFPKNDLEGEPAERIKTTAEIEADMFKTENIKKRAQNRLQFFLKPMPTKEESDQKLLDKMIDENKNRSNKLIQFWNSINSKKEK